jgi:hypothetical protein
MLSARSRRILDQAGIIVVWENYKNARFLLRDHDFPVRFSGGQVPLGEVHEWLQDYRVRSAQVRNTRIFIIVSIFITFVSLIIAIVALS